MCVCGGGGGGGIIEVVRDLHMPGLPSFFSYFLHQIKIGRCSTNKYMYIQHHKLLYYIKSRRQQTWHSVTCTYGEHNIRG